MMTSDKETISFALEIGNQPSYAWRSMFNIKDVIDLGSRWSIGNGQNVRIWKDDWLPNQTGFKVCSPMVDFEEATCISELIDINTKSSKRDLVRNVFSAFEAKQILNIPLSWRLWPDRRILYWERDGNYSVRSAHHLIKEVATKDYPEVSSSNDQSLWKALWMIKAPHSVKKIRWRLAKDILPTRSTLARKGMNLDTI